MFHGLETEYCNILDKLPLGNYNASNQKVTKCQTLRRRAGIDLLCVFFLYNDGLTKKEETDRVRLVRETIWNGLES